ncbi:MAG: sterol desaturase family protein [Hyphomicrobiaceae bacterium]
MRLMYMRLDNIYEGLEHLAQFVYREVATTLFHPASTLSVGSLLAALAIATLWLCRRHIRFGRDMRLKALRRLLFPRRWLLARSASLDVRLMLMNTFVFGTLLASAMISHSVVSGGTRTLLVNAFGTPEPAPVPAILATVLLTIALFLAYELAFWIIHYLSHTVPFLWQLHKVHHSAEVLTPLTVARVHPIEGLLFFNTIALFLGVTDGSVRWSLGQSPEIFTIGNANALVVICTYLIAHLQHTHVWIAFTGPLGRLFISPAHHQIHHSTNPIHFDKNMGGTLAIWDWMFGTLHIPEKKRERLTFGIGDGEVTEHTLAQELMRPVVAIGHEARRLANGAGRKESQGSASN